MGGIRESLSERTEVCGGRDDMSETNIFYDCPNLHGRKYRFFRWRVSQEIPKEKIFEVMEQINQTTVRECIGREDVLLPNVLGLGADVIVTSDCLKEYLEELPV